MAGEVFISYSRRDRTYVDRLVTHLRSFGVPVWVDHDIEYGDEWASVIEERISTCAVFVPVVTPASREAPWVRRVVQLADALRKPVLPLLLDGPIGLMLGITQYEDVTDGSMPDRRFVDRVLALCGVVPPPPAPVVPKPEPEPMPRADDIPIRMSTTYPTDEEPARSPWGRWAALGTAGAVVIAAVVAIVTNLGSGDGGSPAATGTTGTRGPTVPCVWSDPASSEGTVGNVGRPPTSAPAAGTSVFTLTTDRGVIEITMDRAKVPCTAASLAFLAGKQFYNNTQCHRLDEGLAILQCGDPLSTGMGGPGYWFADENHPTTTPAFRAGDVGMARAGSDTNGSQFFIVYGPTATPGDYTLVGRVTKGIQIVEDIAEGGIEGQDLGSGGPPKRPLTITKAEVTTGAA